MTKSKPTAEMDGIEFSQKTPSQNQTTDERRRDTRRGRNSSRVHHSTSVSQNSEGLVSSIFGMVTAPFRSEPMGNQPRFANEQPDLDQDNSNNRENRDRSSEKRNSSRSEDTSHPRNTRFHQKIREQEAEIQQLTTSLRMLSQDSAVRNQHLEEELERCRINSERQETERNRHLRQLDVTNRNLQGKLAMIEDRNRQLEGIIIARQEKALESMAGDRGYAPKEDRLVRDELSKLGEKIRNWARRHSVSSLADLEGVSGDRKDLIVEELRGYTVQADWDTLIGKMTFSPSKIPTLLLQALVVKDVFERMFGDAFFAFTKFRGESNVLDSEEMRRAHNMMAQINEADAHIWRSQTLQNLSKSVGSESKSVVQQRIDSVCSQLVSDFVDNPARELLRPARDGGSARRKELEALYNGAAQLASSLWTQRTFMVCQSQQGLPVFNVANPAMSAHRLHQLDEDDQKLDGNKVMLFVQPAILAFGTENAEDYDRGKVWAPAIVVVDEK